MKRLQAHPEIRRRNAARSPPPDALTPADRYQELFVEVQRRRVFADGKTFVDCAPRDDPEQILHSYRKQKDKAGFDLAAFVQRHFVAPVPVHTGYASVAGQGLAEHIDSLWPFLTREPEQHPVRGSLLQLPHRYVVPGGRFAELYYWDSYFTMLGLAESGLADLVHTMTDNFAYLIDHYGHVPNGTRTYYVSRSQPPVFALMAQLCEDRGGQPAIEYLPQLQREHAFWMAPGRRAVALADGTVLNRYWDDRDTPREESWLEDVTTAAAQHERPVSEVYRHLRAAAESGWDFSSRWLAERDDGAPCTELHTIRTTDLLPVDLNAFMHALERTIARLADAAGDAATSRAFEEHARRREEALHRFFWDDAQGIFVDYDWRLGRRRRCLTAATMVPLYCGVATQAQARRVAQAVQDRLLAPGGFGTSEVITGQQWDRPNGWAPLQWMAAEGLSRYGIEDLASEIRRRWLATVHDLYDREGKLVEKYALRASLAHPARGGGGGEYPLQDGFGWTNGVVRRWLHEGIRGGTMRA